MTTLTVRPIDANQLDLLAQITHPGTPLGSLHMDDFKAACRWVADRNDGWVDPNKVAHRLRAVFGEINPRAYSGRWAAACGRNGFLDKTDQRVPIDPTISRGNGNKTVLVRRWRDAA